MSLTKCVANNYYNPQAFFDASERIIAYLLELLKAKVNKFTANFGNLTEMIFQYKKPFCQGHLQLSQRIEPEGTLDCKASCYIIAYSIDVGH